MLKKLLYKEIALALHPAAIFFLLLSAILLIPNYPMYVVFFYTTLGIYFICLSGRENNDFAYTLSLPVKKRATVYARILFAVILQCVQLALAIMFALLRSAIGLAENAAGMDVNAAFFGLSLIMLGIFNYAFFSGYFAKPDKVGRVFVRSSIIMFVYIAAAEACSFALPFFRDKLDTPNWLYPAEKCAILAAGAAFYAIITFIVARVAAKRFEALDL